MKKFIATMAALMLLAGGASAASIVWANTSASLITGLSGEAITHDNLATYNLVVFLVDASTDATVATSTGIAGKGGNLTGASYNYAFGTTYMTGDKFYIKATMTFGGTDYFFFIGSNGVGADVPSVTPWALTAVNNSSTDTFTWNTTATYGGAGTWVPVPEPATAALALAGLAMLIRRRK